MPPADIADAFLAFEIVSPALPVISSVVISAHPPFLIAVVDVGERLPGCVLYRDLCPRAGEAGEDQSHPLAGFHRRLAPRLGVRQGGFGVTDPAPTAMLSDVRR